MRTLVAGLCVSGVIGGTWLAVGGLRSSDVLTRVPRRSVRRRYGPARFHGPGHDARTNRNVLAASSALGVVAWLMSGWFICLVVFAAIGLGAPYLLFNAEKRAVARLGALEEWTRGLASVLTAGIGLEQAIMATGRSAPQPIQAEVDLLIRRLRARFPTPDALRAFADDLDDYVTDTIAARLILGSERRGSGLAKLLDALAEAVGEQVQIRRDIEADRAKPRAAARTASVISVIFFFLLLIWGDYTAPYASAAGQLLLAVWLSVWGAALIWMKRIARTPQPPRFIRPRVASGAST